MMAHSINVQVVLSYEAENKLASEIFMKYLLPGPKVEIVPLCRQGVHFNRGDRLFGMLNGV